MSDSLDAHDLYEAVHAVGLEPLTIAPVAAIDSNSLTDSQHVTLGKPLLVNGAGVERDQITVARASFERRDVAERLVLRGRFADVVAPRSARHFCR